MLTSDVKQRKKEVNRIEPRTITKRGKQSQKVDGFLHRGKPEMVSWRALSWHQYVQRCVSEWGEGQTAPLSFGRGVQMFAESVFEPTFSFNDVRVRDNWWCKRGSWSCWSVICLSAAPFRQGCFSEKLCYCRRWSNTPHTYSCLSFLMKFK